MIRTIHFFSALLLATSLLRAGAAPAEGHQPVPTPAQLAWQEAEIGALICYELHIFREFVESCRKYGVKPGAYLGTRWNAQLGVLGWKVTDRSTITQQEYNDLIEKEVEEICTRYGELFEIWFDALMVTSPASTISLSGAILAKSSHPSRRMSIQPWHPT